MYKLVFTEIRLVKTPIQTYTGFSIIIGLQSVYLIGMGAQLVYHAQLARDLSWGMYIDVNNN